MLHTKTESYHPFTHSFVESGEDLTPMKNPQAVYKLTKEREAFPYLLGIVAIAWLPIGLGSDIASLFQYSLTSLHFIAAASGTVLFIGIYLWGIWQNIQYFGTATVNPTRTKASVWLTTGILTTLAIIIVETNGKAWGSLFIFSCAYATWRLPTMQAIWTIVGLLLLTSVVVLHAGANGVELGTALFLVGIVGFMIVSMVRSYRTSQALRAARAEIAHLAVANERLRIARDLHDLLGHNLSLITLKSELARRLVSIDSERVTNEISDIEQTARKMLQEVREAVGSYRQPTLASELQGAQEILNAAGIAYIYEDDEKHIDNLPTTVETVFAWAVREGVTNVIRHSRAHQCIIHITRTRYEGQVEIIDDGTGSTNQAQDSTATIPTNNIDHTGNGLRGLAERVASLGGQFHVGPHDAGGFRLAVSIPIVQTVAT
jgi:two-component system, NarL family, sensor histidine kinase DesK